VHGYFDMAHPTIIAAPVYTADRTPLLRRAQYDFSDYGLRLLGSLTETFEVVPARADEEELFLFFFPREDIAAGRWSLYNLHVFLKYSGALETFAHSRGASVTDIPLSPGRAFGVEALTYEREIAMRDLFQGAPDVIDFIGGRPDFMVRDSHTYFINRHTHCYTGMLHPPGDSTRYDSLRAILFRQVELVR